MQKPVEEKHKGKILEAAISSHLQSHILMTDNPEKIPLIEEWKALTTRQLEIIEELFKSDGRRL